MKVVHKTGVRISTLSGAVINLAPGEVRDLPDKLGLLALGQGAEKISDSEPVETAAGPSKLDSVEAGNALLPPPPPVPTRQERLVAVMADIIKRADPADFRADGTPKQAIVIRLFGENVAEEERAAAWKIASTKA